MVKKIILFTVVIILSSFTQSYCKDLESQRNLEESYKDLKQFYLNELPLYENVLLPFLKDIDRIDIKLKDMGRAGGDIIFSSVTGADSHEKLKDWEYDLVFSLSSNISNIQTVLEELRLKAVIIHMIKDTYRDDYYIILLSSLERLKNNVTLGSETIQRQIIIKKPVNKRLRGLSKKFEDIVVSLNSLVTSYRPVIKSLIH
jgi:hypothetical protein